MKIYSMTATFGKLERQTLTLNPGLNIVEAPNEWGKSTWCSFLISMLYGMETRAKSTKTALADKERYQPWSGSLMEGRIELNWQGRDIVIERKTRRRVPLGDFRAYERDTGLDIPELTAANCGQVLLGVERSVFAKSGFIRFSDLPVTQDDALRRRLNSLVTTGDESGTAERLADALRELKNKCRYHKTGLIPQAEQQRDELVSALQQLEEGQSSCARILQRIRENEAALKQLENHRTALLHSAAREDARRVEQARQERDDAAARAEEANRECRNLPGQDVAIRSLKELEKLAQARFDLQMEARSLPPKPEEPEAPPQFDALTPEEALSGAHEDGNRYRELKKCRVLLLILGILGLLAGGILAFYSLIPGLAALVCGLAGLIGFWLDAWLRSRKRKELEQFYGGSDPQLWIARAEEYGCARRRYLRELSGYRSRSLELSSRTEALDARIGQLTAGLGIEACRRNWERILNAWDAAAEANRELQRYEGHLRDLSAMAKNAKAPEFADTLTFTEEETNYRISRCMEEQHLLQNRLGQYQGLVASLGDRQQLLAQLKQKNEQIQRLEKTHSALELAQQTLAEASAELQRRFAPRIAQRARELMSIFTRGRYDRLTLGEDLSLRSGAEDENTLHDSLWRSDGTVDQLYLALRLAVAEELAPQAPVILDDALVRFDDDRAKAALMTLNEIGENKQVILFTCHSREKLLAAQPKT